MKDKKQSSIKCQVSQTTKRIKCEIYSRPVGYLRTVSSWNDAKKEEFADRNTYDCKEC